MRRSPPAICARDVARHLDLPLRVLAASWRASSRPSRARARRPCAARAQAASTSLGAVVGPARAAAQDDVAVVVAARSRRSRPAPILVMPMKACGARAGHQRVGGHLHAAVGAVLEPDRAAQARRQLAVARALGRARADRAPARSGPRCTAGSAGPGTRWRPAARACAMSSSSWRARRRPSLMRKLPSRRGSLMKPFQPTVVRGFSK